MQRYNANKQHIRLMRHNIMSIEEIIKAAVVYEDRALRTELAHVLNVLSSRLKHLSREELLALRKHLYKVVNY